MDISTYYRDLSTKMILDLAGLDCIRRILLNDLEKFYVSLMVFPLRKYSTKIDLRLIPMMEPADV